MRIEGQAEGIDAFHPELGEVVHELLVNELEAFAVIFVLRFAKRQGMLETVHHRN